MTSPVPGAGTITGVEWVGLPLWLLVAGMALGVGAASLSAPPLGLHTLLVVAGLVFAVLYVVLGGGRWLAWASAGLALVAALALGAGVAQLVSDEPRASPVGEDVEELSAGLAGAEWPFLLTVAFCMGSAAAGITTIG